jgi:hypothetical protein
MWQKVCTPSQTRWLNRFYLNSEAYHERQVMQKSITWHQQMNHLKACWGDPPPRDLQVQQSPCQDEIKKMLTDYEYTPKEGVWITNGPNMRM